MYNEYVDQSIQGSWKEKHKAVIEDFLRYLNSLSQDYILKGGTSLMECYGLTRFSEDIDLDSPNKNEIFNIVKKYCKETGYNYRIAKDTETVSRFMLDYGGISSEGPKPLKIEISHRKSVIKDIEITKINGFEVYILDQIALMKANAYAQRDKIRDLYDITYLINHKYDELNPIVIDNVRNVVGQKGLEQFDYIVATQKDDLIDEDKLASDFLKAYEKLDLLVPQNQKDKDIYSNSYEH